MGSQIDKTWWVPEFALKAFQTVKAEREKVQKEAARLKDVLGEFLQRGDITREYYDQALNRLGDLLPPIAER